MKLFGNEITTNAKSKTLVALCTAAALTAVTASAQEEKTQDQGAAGRDNKTAIGGQSSQLNRNAEQFIMNAAKSGMMEVQLGKLGVQKAQNAEVKRFAQTLVTDHTKANAELRTLAASKGITLPTPPADALTQATGETDRTPVRETEEKDSAHKDAKEEMQKLQSASANEFDALFIKTAVKHHEKGVEQFESAAKTIDDVEVKAFANKTLPVLREHLQQAKGLHTRLEGAGAAGTGTGTQSGTEKSSGVKTENGSDTKSPKLNEKEAQ